MHRSTRDHNTRDHRTKDHNNRYLNNTSNGHQSNGPNILRPKVCHHKENSMDDRNGGIGTDDVSDNNPLRHHYSLRHTTRCHHIHTFVRSDQGRILYHVYKR